MLLVKTSRFGSVWTAALEKLAASMATFPNRGKLGWYLAVRVKADSPEEQKALAAQFKALGYADFRGAFTKLIQDQADFQKVQAELTQLSQSTNAAIDLSGLNSISQKLTTTPTPVTPDTSLSTQRPEQPGAAVTDTPPPAGGTPTQTIVNMAEKFKDDLKKTPVGERGEMAGKRIEEYLENLAREVDDAKKQGFISQYLEFSSKFWKYSFVNQMLIGIQSDWKATNVAGYQRWLELGRQIQAGAKSLVIFAPMLKNGTDKTTGEKNQFLIGFTTVNVFDISHTKPLEGDALAKWQGKNQGKTPFEPASKDWWMSKQNADSEKTLPLRNAAMEFAAEKGIEVNLSEETGHAGGWSTGGEIAISHESAGERQFSIIIHEIAHELLHQSARAERKRGGVPETELGNKLDLEVDAESVAYIVMKHFGFDASHAPNYLALSGASGLNVQKRRSNISKAVKWIIEGITKNLAAPAEATMAPEVQAAPEEPAGPAMASWVRRHCKFAIQTEPMPAEEKDELTHMFSAMPAEMKQVENPLLNKPGDMKAIHQTFEGMEKPLTNFDKVKNFVRKNPLTDTTKNLAHPISKPLGPLSPKQPPSPYATHPKKP